MSTNGVSGGVPGVPTVQGLQGLQSVVEWPYGRTIDVQIVLPRPTIGKAFVAATLLDALAITLVTAGGGSAAAYGLAGLCHTAAVLPLMLGLDAGPDGSRRLLAIALTATLPLVGAMMAVLALSVRGQAQLAEPMPPADTEAPPMDANAIRRAACALPACEALLAAPAEERRALIAVLTRRADRSTVEVLRGALTAPNRDLALEAALALEEISATFERRLADARAELTRTPTRAAAMAAGDLVSHAIDARIVDPTLIGPLYAEARRCYALAEELEPAAAPVIAAAWARLELAALKPDLALEIVERALAAGDAEPDADDAVGSAPARSPSRRPSVVGERARLRRELEALRAEALLEAHDLPWEGSSGLLTGRTVAPLGKGQGAALGRA
jgi:hypothetical protein